MFLQTLQANIEFYIVLCDPVYASPAVAAVSIYALIKNLLHILAASETWHPPQKNQKPPNKTKSHWSDISTHYYALLLKIPIVPWNGREQEMTASLADYTCPSSSRQPTHWRACQRSWPTTGHFLPAQNFHTGVEKIKQCQKGTDERKMDLSITKVRRLAFK